jgi:hypothetical protein
MERILIIMEIKNIELPFFGKIYIFNEKKPISKVAHVFTSTMIQQEYIDKIFYILNWYKEKWNMSWDIFVLNDGLDEENIKKLIQETNCTVIAFEENLGRSRRFPGEPNDYPYEWRNLNYVKNIFEDYNYEKIILNVNDFYILTQKMMNFIDSQNEGWISCENKYGGGPDTSFQIINNKCSVYNDFVEKHIDFMKHNANLKMYEFYVPFTYIDKETVYGGRYFQNDNHDINKWDFVSMQTSIHIIKSKLSQLK